MFNFIRNIYYLTRMYYYNPRTNGIAWIDLFFSIAYRVVSIGIIYFIYIHFDDIDFELLWANIVKGAHYVAKCIVAFSKGDY